MYTLSDNCIDRISDEIVSFLSAGRVPEQSRTRIRLAAEDLLMKYRDRFGEDTVPELSLRKRFGKLHITLKLHCESFDPIGTASDEDFMLRNLLRSLGYEPVWSFHNDCNEICFTVRSGRRFPSWAVILIAGALGILGGFLSRLLPAEALTVLTDTILSPVGSAIMGFLSAVSGLLISLSIISGIIGMGSVSTLNRIGKKLIGHIMLWMLLLSVLLIILLGMLFPIGSGGGMGFDFGSLWSMILDIIPDSLIEPFATGNALQILFISIVVGIVILSSISKLTPVVNVIDGCNLIISDIVALILDTMPLVVFISLLDLFSTPLGEGFGSVFKFPLLLFILSFAWLGITLLRVCVKQKVGPGVLLRKIFPAFLIAFSTGSSSAALTTSLSSCEKELGISPGLVKAGIPLSYSVNKPSAAILFLTAALCMAQVYGVDVSWTGLASMSITSMLLAVAAPAIPGGAISACTLLFTIYGIPLEALSIVISLDVITDRIATPVLVAVSQLELIQVASETGNLDRDVLRSRTVYTK